MTKKALILDEMVCQVVNTGDEFEVAPPLTWVDCTMDVEANGTWEYVGGTVQKRQETKEETNARTLQVLNGIDRQSIRGLREFIAKKFANDASLPSQILANENNAKAARAKLIK